MREESSQTGLLEHREKICHSLSLLEAGRRKSFTGLIESIWGEKCDHGGVPDAPSQADRRKANPAVLDLRFWFQGSKNQNSKSCLDLTYSSNVASFSEQNRSA